MALQGTILLFFLLLVSFCHGAPAEFFAGSELIDRATADQYSFCNLDATYNPGTGKAPSAADCQVMIDRIQGGGVYNLPLNGQILTLIKYKSCKFTAEGTQTVQADAVNIGNKDIITYVKYMIDHYTTDGKVTGWGYTRCLKVDAVDNPANYFRIVFDVVST